MTFLDMNAHSTDKERIGKKSETKRLESALSLDTNQNRIHKCEEENGLTRVRERI